jgi:solute:Na+ symporter, SSS family
MTWQDHVVLVTYLAGMLALGGWFALRQSRAADRDAGEEYFLAGRRMPWLAVGASVIASLLSSLTYLSEPGEVWHSGITHVLGKVLAVPVEIAIVWAICIPFAMRFRFTSAYEYLEHRFDRRTRLLGVVLFVLLVVLWMGFVVLASARALAAVSGFSLLTVIATVGLVATLYTMVGGLRAVIWTDVIQVLLLIGGGLFVIGYVAVTTGSDPVDWLAATREHLAREGSGETMPWFSFSPHTRATVFTVAISMAVWHVCTHTSNQMTVQRYYSTADTRAARRSFLTAMLLGLGINLMLVVVGLALLYQLGGSGAEQLDLDVSTKQGRDLVFPAFAVQKLPPGCGGAILAALLAAAMSSIDSGINSIATVVTVERRRSPEGNVRTAMTLTLLAGVVVTFAAYGLDFLPARFGIVDALPRTFNAITGPLGGLFLIGMFVGRASGRTATIATGCGLVTSLVIGYWQNLVELAASAGLVDAARLADLGLLDETGAALSLSFTWVMPGALAVTLLVAWLLSRFDADDRDLAGLTWWTRHEPSPWTA